MFYLAILNKVYVTVTLGWHDSICYTLSMFIILTIFDVSIEDERVYGILCIGNPWAKEPQDFIAHFCELWGNHVQHPLTQKVFKTEILCLQFRKGK